MKKSVAVWAMALAAAWLGLAAGEVRAEFAWGESAWVSAGRVDCRGDFGGRLVHGTERMGAPDGGAASAWNTTKLADGWQTVTKGTNTAEVAVLNKGTVAIEYGRLSGNASWGSGKVHVVRDWVAVPSGVTLEIGAGAVVKFTRGSGIAVERGGTLRLAGTADAPVRMTAAEDDTEGGDTDMREAELVGGWYIDIRGTVEDSGWTEIDLTDRSRSGGMANYGLRVGVGKVSWGGTGWAPAGRVDAREDFGGRLVHGTERMGAPDGGAASAWNTTKLADGWQTVTKGTNTAEVAVLNKGGVAIEYGRLSGDASWGSGKVHVVRDWVAVPSGMTLEIGAGTVVKFTRGSGIAVERGGTLRLAGTAAAPVRLTAAEDDTEGGDTDMREAEPVGGWYIDIHGTVEDSGWTEIDHTDRSRSGGMANYGLRVGVGKVSWGGTGWAPAGRVDAREDFGGRLVHGTERMGNPDGGAASAWNTTKLADGWQTVTKGTNTAEVAVLNKGTVAIEYGRLSGDVSWDSGKVHVVRDWVAVPSGVTLEIGAGTVVKFTRGSGIAVERGGTLRLAGTADAPVRLTAAEDDTEGGDTDMREAELVGGWYIDIRGTVEDSGWTEIDHSDRSRSGGMANYGLRVGVGKVSWGGTGWTPAGRVDAREDFGGRLVHGTERMGAPDGGAVSAWNTAKLADGWQTVTKGTNTAEVAVLNKGTVAIEYGRLSGDASWESGKVHVVRDWVAVPSGVTLEIGAGTLVKFTRGSGIAVERGGTLRLAGTADAPVRLTAAEDDTEGGDTDMREAELVGGWYIDIRGKVEDSGWTEIGYADPSRSGGMAIYGLRVGAGKLDVGRSANSSGTRVDGRAGRNGPRLTMGDEWAVWDTAWDNAAEVRVTLERPDGTEELLGRATNGGKGSADWTGNEPGAYRVGYSAKDGSGTVLAAQTVQLVMLGDGTILHSGSTKSNEIWSADSVHVVDGRVSVGNGAALAIEPGAVVKFTDGSSLVVAGGGSCTACGVVFTHIADDTVGGDTMLDGAASWPVPDAYSVTGNLTTDAETQMRWMKVMTSGTVSTDTVWMGSRIVHVTGNLTVASGATLTIHPGAIVKFEPGVSLTVNSGGTLNALGTRAQPIVFTSIKDDEFGGDTNGDGGATAAQPGDWTTIKVAGGTAHFSHASILYSSRNQTTGAINMTGGTVVFDSGEIAHGLYDAVGVESGNFHMANSVIRDCLLAFRHWARDPIVNCVIYDCGRLTQGGGQHFRNCIFANITEAWEAFGFPQNGTTYDNCCFWNAGGSVLTGEGTQDAMTVCGKNGNIWGDPLFLDADGGDFRVAEGSPCVDAGDTAAAPETDFFGQPRASAFGEAVADIGIYEVQPRGVAGDVDLVPVSVSADAEAVPGGELRVSWVVGNRGGKVASGARRDAVSLVSAGGREVALGEKVFTQNVAAGGTAKCEAVFRLPAMAEGTWWPKVVVNSQQDIFEGSLIANNARTGEGGVEVSVPATASSAGASGTVAAGVPTVLKLHFEAGDGNRMVVLDVPQGVSVAWGFGFVPQGEIQSGKMTAASGIPVQFLVPDAEDEMDVYVLLASDRTETYELSTESTKLTVTGVTPGTLPSSGTATLTIAGAGFGETNAVTLVGAGASIRLSAVERDGSGNLVSTVECSLLAGGATYAARVESDGREAELPNAVSVAKVEGKGILEAKLIATDSARQGRIATGFIEYANVGNADMFAPVFKITGGMEKTQVAPFPFGGAFTNTLHTVGIGSGYPAGILKAGEKRRLPFSYMVVSSYELRLSIVDTESEWNRESRYPTWEAFGKGIADAATMLNAGPVEVSCYDDIYAQAIRMAYELPSGCAAGTLRDVLSGEAISDAVLVFADADGVAVGSAVTDSDGLWCVQELDVGGVYSIQSVDCQMGDCEFTIPESGVATMAIEALPLATFKCLVEGLGDKEIKEGCLTAVSEFGDRIQATFQNESFVFEGLPDGAYTLYGDAPGVMVATNTCPVVVENGRLRGGIPLIGFVHGGVLELSLSDNAGGAPVASVPVSLYGENGVTFEFLSDVDGGVHAKLPPGNYAAGVGTGYVAENIPSIAMAARETNQIAIVVEEMPFAVFPSCGPAVLESEFALVNTNAWGEGFTCAWDFDGDGRTDSTELSPTHSFADSGVHAVSLRVTLANGETREYTHGSAVEVWEPVEAETWDETLVLANETDMALVSSDAGGFTVRGADGSLPCGFWEGRIVVLPGEDLSPRRIVEVIATSDETLVCKTEEAYVTEAFKTLRASARFVSTSSAGITGYKTYTPLKFDNKLEFPDLDIKDKVKFKPEFAMPVVVSVEVADGEVKKFVASASVIGKLDATIHTPKCKIPDKTPNDRTIVSWSTPVLPPVLGIPSHFSISYVAQAELKGEGTLHYAWGKKWECVWIDDGKGFRKNAVPLDHSFSVSGKAEWDVKAGLEFEYGLGARKSSSVYADLANIRFETGLKEKISLELNSDDFQADKYEFYVGVYAEGKFNLGEARYKKLHATAFSVPFDLSSYLPNRWKLSYSWETPMPAYSTEAEKTGENTYSVTLRSKTTVPDEAEFKSRRWKIGGAVVGDGSETVSKQLSVAPDDTVEYETMLFEGYQPGVDMMRWIGLALFDHQKASKSKIVLRGGGKQQEPEILFEKFTGSVPQSCDPNEMSGPLGAGARRLVAPGEWMTYTVFFENKSDATAAAQEVYVTEQLSGALDWSTFEMVDVGFNNQLDLGLGGKRRGASVAAMEGTAYKVRTELDFDAKTGAAKWYMRILDESTETRWPRDVYAGFLPPNDATGRGEGHITYRVKLRDDAAAGTVVRASANIVFDYNAAIETDPAWWNTVAEMGTATVDLGNGVSTNVTVMVGAPWVGQLPDPGKRPGMRFAGWFTGPNGTGSEVTEESVAAAGAKLYAFWDATAAPELWLDVSWGAVEIGTNGVVKGYGRDGEAAEGMANRYVLTGTSRVNGVKFAGGSFTNTWTNLVIDLDAKDAVAVTLEGASVEVTLAGDNALASGEDCAGMRVDAASALVLQGEGRLVAQGGKCGAGIGGGKLQESGRVEIHSGTVEATGGEFGAGIGGGLVAPAAGAVVITGGSVKARGSDGGEDIGGGFGREGTGVPVDAGGAEVHEVEVPLATDTLPAEVVVDLGDGKTYRYAGPGHEGDKSLWFWLPDGTYEFDADGDDYGAHVAGEGTAAVFTDPGNANFVAPPMGEVSSEGGAMRAAVNPAYRTSPFEVWSATGLKGNAWDWTLVPAGGYEWDATNAVIRIPDGTNRTRVVRLRFVPR